MNFKVLSNLKHDGKEYKIGDIIELAEVIASSLVEDGIIEKVEETAEDKAKAKAKAKAKEEADAESKADEKNDDDATPVLEEILKKEVDDLTEEEIDILKNAQELNEEDREKFASVLE